MEIIKLNIIPSGVNPTCHASQYDENRVIRVELYEGLTPFTLQANDEISLAIRKPDDKIVTMVVENTEDNYVDIVTTKQACAVVGANLCELTIKRSSVNIGTLNFYMQVERDPLADGDDSESEIRDLQERVNACVEIALEDLYDGTSVLFDAEPVLDHDEPYTVTSNGIAQAFGAVNTALEGKVDSSYLTTNYYNKTQVDGALSGKVDNSELDYYYTKNDTYSKNEVNNLFSSFGIDDLNDVEIDEQTLAAGQGIVYDALTGKFINGEVSSTSTLEELTDTDITDEQDGDGILFNATSNKWINQAITKEISQAAYDNLSQAEKENGTVYYVPDAPSTPVTASDIEYSAGVSVADKLESLDVDLAFKRISFVVPIDAISSGTSKSITASDANYTIPSGYKAVSYYVQYCYGSNTRNLNIWSCNLDATGTSTFIEIQNMGSGATTSGATITLVVLFAKNSRVSTTA